MEICISVLAKIAEYAVLPIRPHISYLIHYEKKAEHLSKQVERLCDIKTGLELEVEAARRNMKTIAPDVERWLLHVQEIVQENKSFENERVANTRCCNGLCPNLKSRYSLGRKVKKMTLVVKKLLEDGSFQKVSYPGPPPEIGLTSTLAVSELHEEGNSSGLSNPSEGLEHRLPYTKEILEALQDDKIKVIGILGIVRGEEIVNEVEFVKRVKHLFEDAVTISITPNPNLKKIQGEIADMLGLKFENESIDERAAMLSARMVKDSKRFLVLLYDVCKRLDFKAVGIPHFGVRMGCKIIMMSEQPNIFNEMRTVNGFKLILASEPIGGPIALESRNLIFRDIMDALKNDQINPIVICGLGGIGKTTMVKEIGRRAKSLGLFNEVVMAVVTQKPNIRDIQDEIAEFLGLDLLHLGKRARAQYLSVRLSSNKRVLEILDDVWIRLDLVEIGIPLLNDGKSCKILATSRNQDIFNEMKTKKNFTIGVLPQPEDWNLFKEMAGSYIESPDLCPIAKQVLSECGGLPIAISTVGKALQYKSKEIWKNALRQLRKATPDHISGMKIDVYRKIELSYECLESEEAKSCFLLCCLYPKSSSIPIEDLIRHMLGLWLFRDIESVADGRNSVIASIDILKSCFLLMDSKKQGCIEMHEVVRDVALSIASKSENALAASHGVKLKDWPKSGVHRQLYTSTVMTNSGIDSRKYGTKPELLLVSCTDTSSIPPAAILDGMEKLKVLEMRRANVVSILPSLPQLKHLHTLCLEHCILQDVSVIGELRTLLILSLRNSDIKELPSKIGNLSNLKLLDLARCDTLQKISPDVISSFGKLEELYMGGTSVRWTVWEQGKWIANMILLELLSICHLTTLEIGVLVLIPEIVQENITFFNNLERFKICIGSEYDFWDVNSCENHLRLQHNSNEVWSEIYIFLIKKDAIVELHQVYNLRSAFNVLDEACFVNLQSLTVEHCDGLEYLIDTTFILIPPSAFPMLRLLKIIGTRSLKEICHGELPKGSFKELRELFLFNLPELTHLWTTPTQFECLRNLRRVKIFKCENLKSLFLLSTANNLGQLEEIDIQTCSNLEEVVVFQGWEEAYDIEFPYLLRLNLERLPSLLGISKNVVKINFYQLITLKLELLPELISLSPNNLALESSSSTSKLHLFDSKANSCPQLKYMVIDSCENLSRIFSFDLVQNLHNLEQLEVRNCSSLRKLFDLEDLDIREKDIATATLSSLEKMELTDLPMLAYVWNPPQNIMAFQNLRLLQIVRCGRLKNVFPFFIAEVLLKLESIYISDCDMMEEVVAECKDGEATNKFVVARVNAMHLDQLPYLLSFCPTARTVEWPSLRTLVLCCKKMKVFIPAIEANAAHSQAKIHIFNEQVDFPVLEALELRKMDDVEEIWSQVIPPSSFCELRDLNISNCDKLLLLVPSNLQNKLQKLERITVSDCKSLEDIFEFRRLNEGGEQGVTVTLPANMQLSRMDLDQNPKFQNLKSIQISGCGNLRNLLSPSMAKGLVNLKSLSVSGCLMMEEIIRKPAEGEEMEDNAVLPQISSLTLDCLPKLTSFSKDIDTFEWPLMEQINIAECTTLKTFFFKLVCTQALEKVELDNGCCWWHRNIHIMWRRS